MVVVLKGGYDVMYSAHDGIHMPPVMSYITGVMNGTLKMSKMVNSTEVLWLC